MVQVAVSSGHGWLLARERDTLHRGELLVLEPSLSLEEHIIEADGSISVATHQIIGNGQQDVDRLVIDVKLHDFLELFLTDLADTSLDLGDLPDEDFTIGGTCDSLLSTWQEDSLRVGLVLAGRVVFADGGAVVLERLGLVSPLHEEDATGAVARKLMGVHRVELDPVGGTDGRVVELHGYLRAILVLVRPVPKRACLGIVGAQSCDVPIVSREVHLLDATRVWLQESADRGARP